MAMVYKTVYIRLELSSEVSWIALLPGNVYEIIPEFQLVTFSTIEPERSESVKP